MPKWKYALEPGGEKSLEISIGTFIWQKKTEVRLNGNLIGVFPNQKELAEGRVLQLPDGTTLRIQFVRTFFSLGFRVLRNDKPLPGSKPLPAPRLLDQALPPLVAGVTAPAPGSPTGATRSHACAKCSVQRDGQDVRSYYGNKISKSSQSYGTGKKAMVITTTSYTVGGWEDVSICDHCTKVRSLWRFFNVLWSVPLGLGCAWIFVSFVVELFSGGIHGGFNSYYVVFLFFCGLFGILKTVDYVICLVKPLNETSRSAVARLIVEEHRIGKYDTFWTQAELEKLQNPNFLAKSGPRGAAGGALKHPVVAGSSNAAATIPDKINAAPQKLGQTRQSTAESTSKENNKSSSEYHGYPRPKDDVIKIEQSAHTTTQIDKKGEKEMSNEETITQFLQQLGSPATPFNEFQIAPGIRVTVAMYMGLQVEIQIHQGNMLVAQFVIGYIPKMNAESLLRQLMILNSTMIGAYFCVFSANNAIVLRTSRVIEGLDFVEFKQALDTLCLAFSQNARQVAQTFQIPQQPV